MPAILNKVKLTQYITDLKLKELDMVETKLNALLSDQCQSPERVTHLFNYLQASEQQFESSIAGEVSAYKDHDAIMQRIKILGNKF